MRALWAIMSLMLVIWPILALLARIRSLTVMVLDPALDSIYGPPCLDYAVRYTLLPVSNAPAIPHPLTISTLVHNRWAPQGLLRGGSNNGIFCVSWPLGEVRVVGDK